MHAGDAGTSELAAALDRGALPRLKILSLYNAAIGDAALVALAPVVRRLPALERLYLSGNLFGDEGLAALVAPPPPAGAPPPPTGGLTKLKLLYLSYTQITDAGCAALAAALESGELPALDKLILFGTPTSHSYQTGPLPRRKSTGIPSNIQIGLHESTPENAPRLPIQNQHCPF
jgi:hypothetical protein